MPEALPELTWFALLFFCFAFVWAARKLLAAMFQPLIAAISKIPLAGGVVADLLHTMEQAVDSALGTVEHRIDALMGASFHRFSELNRWLWDEFKQHTLIGQIAATEISALTHAYEFIRNLAHHAAAIAGSIPHRIRAIEREFHGIEHRVKTLEHDIAHGIGHDVLPRLRSLDRRVEHITDDALPAIRAAEQDAASAIDDLYSWAKGKAALLGVGTFAFAVAAVIGADVLKLFKCPTFLGKTLGRGCGLWNGLESLFGLFIDALVLTNICDVLPWIEEGFAAVEGLIVPFISNAANALCAKPPAGWAKLDVAQGPLPPPQTLGPFGS